MQRLPTASKVNGPSSRAMPDTSHLFKPLEDTIRADFIRSLLRRDVNDLERDMLSLPARMGGMGIFKPDEEISNTNSDYISTIGTPDP